MTELKLSRRRYLSALGLLGISSWIAPSVAIAKKPEAMETIAKIVGANTVRDGRVKLVIPPLVESGNLVVLKLSIESPMTANDYVKAVHVVSEANPSPNMFTAYFTPRSGRAELTTRVRLADSQRVWAIAQMSDGSFWRGSADTLVTLSACTEMI
ncbi:SoxY-related AACIE arm protein [Polynucleobacter asymbioticus]|jgi:sulfur-oxidizing protein SoxY|uniref:SoxY-related AACIE arm protein n=1 Tax=Polynucleobacter asymbioticus TaxID=576611 RepID=UPI001BFDFF7A|nr:SoxY-related AACIE arm protein [Polynucleobacter asymbioticus]QWD85842.1 SoxY-related AACIE arm protein [Polynucleobacter asymbioticus]